jgi:circadian clock protein KaiB
VYQQQKLAESEQIVALPLLIKKKPLPERRLIGDLSDTEKVLKGLGLFG